MATGYSVTIKNDNTIFDLHGLVHTWLVLTAPDGEQFAISFAPTSPSQALASAPGLLENPKGDILNRPASGGNVTMEITKTQFDTMIAQWKADKDYGSFPYNMVPGQGDYNCVTYAARILQAGGIHYLDGILTPDGVFGKIHGIHIGEDIYSLPTVVEIAFKTGEITSQIRDALLDWYHKNFPSNPTSPTSGNNDNPSHHTDTPPNQHTDTPPYLPDTTDSSGGGYDGGTDPTNVYQDTDNPGGGGYDGGTDTTYVYPSTNDSGTDLTTSIPDTDVTDDGTYPGNIDTPLDQEAAFLWLGNFIGLYSSPGHGTPTMEEMDTFSDVMKVLYGAGGVDTAIDAQNQTISEWSGILDQASLDKLNAYLDTLSYLKNVDTYYKDAASDDDTDPDDDADSSSDSVNVPVVLDLNGNGIELVAAAAGARFDWNGDGVTEKTGWVRANDAILAYDFDGDKQVTMAQEISFKDYQPGAATDLQGLVHFDTNGDGVIDNNDAEWAKFGAWQDGNGDGVCDDGEFKSLDAAGIVALSLASDNNTAIDDSGNIIYGMGSYTTADGQTHILGDVGLIREKTELVQNDDGALASANAAINAGKDGDTPPTAGENPDQAATLAATSETATMDSASSAPTPTDDAGHSSGLTGTAPTDNASHDSAASVLAQTDDTGHNSVAPALAPTDAASHDSTAPALAPTDDTSHDGAAPALAQTDNVGHDAPSAAPAAEPPVAEPPAHEAPADIAVPVLAQTDNAGHDAPSAAPAAEPPVAGPPAHEALTDIAATVLAQTDVAGQNAPSETPAAQPPAPEAPVDIAATVLAQTDIAGHDAPSEPSANEAHADLPPPAMPSLDAIAIQLASDMATAPPSDYGHGFHDPGPIAAVSVDAVAGAHDSNNLDDPQHHGFLS